MTFERVDLTELPSGANNFRGNFARFTLKREARKNGGQTPSSRNAGNAVADKKKPDSNPLASPFLLSDRSQKFPQSLGKGSPTGGDPFNPSPDPQKTLPIGFDFFTSSTGFDWKNQLLTMGNPSGVGDGDGDEDSDDDDDSEDGGRNVSGVVPPPRVLPPPGTPAVDVAMLNAFSDIASASRSQADINRKLLSHQKRTAKRKREERSALLNLTEQMH